MNVGSPNQRWFTEWTLVHRMNVGSPNERWFTEWTLVHRMNVGSPNERWFTEWTLVHRMNVGSPNQRWFTKWTLVHRMNVGSPNERWVHRINVGSPNQRWFTEWTLVHRMNVGSPNKRWPTHWTICTISQLMSYHRQSTICRMHLWYWINLYIESIIWSTSTQGINLQTCWHPQNKPRNKPANMLMNLLRWIRLYLFTRLTCLFHLGWFPWCKWSCYWLPTRWRTGDQCSPPSCARCCTRSYRGSPEALSKPKIGQINCDVKNLQHP